MVGEFFCLNEDEKTKNKLHKEPPEPMSDIVTTGTCTRSGEAEEDTATIVSGPGGEAGCCEIR